MAVELACRPKPSISVGYGSDCSDTRRASTDERQLRPCAIDEPDNVCDEHTERGAYEKPDGGAHRTPFP
jgi:hypothetical protein